MDQQQLSDPDNDEHSMAHIHLADFSHCTPISLPSKTDHLHPTTASVEGFLVQIFALVQTGKALIWNSKFHHAPCE